jgi:hypothetical protein
MFDFIDWYFPWAYIDSGLKLQLLVWFASILAGVIIFIRTILFKKPWLTLHWLRQDKHNSP